MSARGEWSVVVVLALASAGVWAALHVRGDEGRARAAAAAPGAPTADGAESAAHGPQAPVLPVLPERPLAGGLPTEGQWRGHPELADLDADGRLDLLASIRRWDRERPGDGLNVWLQGDDGGWIDSVRGMRRDMGYGGVAVADVDGDGHLDLAFSGHDVVPHVYLGDGAGSWAVSWTAYDIEGVCADVALGDFDQDGKVDLATLGFFSDGDGLVAYRGDGAGAFDRWEVLLPSPAYGATVDSADVDGDGRPELVAATSVGVRVFGLDGDGAWEDRSTGLPQPEVGGTDLGILAVDLDDEAGAELLAAGMVYPGHAPLQAFRWDGAAWAPWGRGLPVGEAFFDVAVTRAAPGAGLTVAVPGKHGVQLLAMTTPGAFVPRGRIENTEGVLNVAFGDVDGDGTDELLCVGFGGVRFLELPDAPPLAANDAPSGGGS